MKRALVALAVLAGVATVGAILAWNSIDLLVRVALEHWGPDVTGVKVDVAEVRISPRDGRGHIAGLEVGNPAGFSSPRAARFGEIRIVIDPASLTSDIVVVRELAISAAQLTYERGERGANLDAIQRSIDAYVKASGASDNAPGKARSKRRFIVERLTIRKARVLMTNKGLGGQGLTFDLPEVDLREVGRREGGITASQVAGVVTATLQQKIALKLLSNVDALRRGGLEGAIDALRNLAK